MGYARPIYNESIKYGFLKLYGKFKMYFTCATYIIMVIEVSGVQFRLKSSAWFEITSMISNQNCMTRGSITTILHPLWNHPITGLSQFKYFIDTVLNRFEIKFIHFGQVGGGGEFEFWKQKLQNLPHDALCLSFSYSLICYFKKALKCDWLFCF